MSRTNSIRTIVLPTFGDQDVFTGAIYSAPTSYGAKDSKVLVNPGRIVFYSPELGVGINEATNSATYSVVKVGVGVDLDGDGESEYIRWAAELHKCSLKEQASEHASCGVGTIADLLFNDCNLECGRAYGFQIQVFTPVTQSFGPDPAIGYTYDFVYTPPCPPCDNGDCAGSTVSPDQIMCGLYNLITQKKVDPNWNVKLNNFPVVVNEHQFLFDVAQLYDATDNSSMKTTYEYCFTEADSTCKECDYVTLADADLPRSVSSVLGSLDDAAISATYFTDLGSDANKVTRAGFRKLAAEITRILDGKGTAVYLEPTGNCCDNHKIEVNTCLTDFALENGADTDITPCATSNPFDEPVTIYNECQDCDNTNDTTSFTAGLRFYSKAIQGDCDCIAGNKALVEYFAELELYPAFGFEGTNGAAVVYQQKATLAKNQGFQWQPIEISNLREYEGENFVYENWEGKYGVPAKNDILNHVQANCKESYCVMSGTFRTPFNELPNGFTINPQIAVHILIPEGEDTAGGGIADAWNGIFAADCGPVGTITCVIEQIG